MLSNRHNLPHSPLLMKNNIELYINCPIHSQQSPKLSSVLCSQANSPEAWEDTTGLLGRMTERRSTMPSPNLKYVHPTSVISVWQWRADLNNLFNLSLLMLAGRSLAGTSPFSRQHFPLPWSRARILSIWATCLLLLKRPLSLVQTSLPSLPTSSQPLRTRNGRLLSSKRPHQCRLILSRSPTATLNFWRHLSWCPWAERPSPFAFTVGR